MTRAPGQALRRGLVVLLVLAALLVLADRVAEGVAEGAVADRAQRSAGLSERPRVDVLGGVFLLQALRGRYDEVRLRTAGDVGGTRLERLDVHLAGVRLPLAEALAGDVRDVPVDGVSGTALVSYRELSARAGHGLEVAPAGDRLRVTGATTVLGRTLQVAAMSSVRVDGDRVVVRAQSFTNGSGLADRVLDAALGDRFDVDLPVGPLPLGLRLSGLQVRQDGVALDVASGPTVLAGSAGPPARLRPS